MRFELHPLASLFPRMAGAEFEALKTDIAANGLRQPIVTHQGMILDGGNRYAACMAVGVKPMMVEYTGTNLVTYVMSVNFHRRHLSPGQQAAIVASAQDWATAQTVGKPKSGNVTGLQTVADRAAVSGASDKTQRMADKLAKESPELATKVAHGEISLPKAAKQGKPAKAPKSARFDPLPPDASTALEETQQAVSALSEENDRLNDRLAVAAIDATEEERTAAAETIANLRAQVKTLDAELRAVRASRDGLMVENNEMKKQIAGQRRQLQKLQATPPALNGGSSVVNHATIRGSR